MMLVELLVVPNTCFDYINALKCMHDGISKLRFTLRTNQTF